MISRLMPRIESEGIASRLKGEAYALRQRGARWISKKAASAFEANLQRQVVKALTPH